jgi:hypothetical protein
VDGDLAVGLALSHEDRLDALISHGASEPLSHAYAFFNSASGPLHGVLGLHALDGLGVHVHEDVLDQASDALRLGAPGYRASGRSWRLF